MKKIALIFFPLFLLQGTPIFAMANLASFAENYLGSTQEPFPKIEQIVMHPSGEQAFAVLGDCRVPTNNELQKSVLLWSREQGEPVKNLGKFAGLQMIALNTSNQELAIVHSYGEKLTIINYETNAILNKQEFENKIRQIKYMSEGKILVVATKDDILVLNAQDLTQQRKFAGNNLRKIIDIEPILATNKIAISYRTYFEGMEDYLDVWDFKEDQSETLSGLNHSQALSNLHSIANKLLVINGESLIIYNNENDIVNSFSMDNKDPVLARFTPDTNSIVIGTKTGKIFFYNAQNFKLIRQVRAHGGQISGIDFDSSGKVMVSSAKNGMHNIKFWDLESGDAIRVGPDETRLGFKYQRLWSWFFWSKDENKFQME